MMQWKSVQLGIETTINPEAKFNYCLERSINNDYNHSLPINRRVDTGVKVVYTVISVK